MSKDPFINHLNKATKTVNSWPEWKQSLLGAATKKHRQKEISLKEKKNEKI